MKAKYRFYLFMLSVCLLMAGCGDDDKKPVTVAQAAPKKPVVMDPFRFHKMIEVSPGEDYDILSWGRGSSKAGAFLILHSDSAAAKYSTTTGDLDGTMVDVYNSDMDMDGNPEILIQARGTDSLNYTNIYAFEFNSNNGKVQKLDFPKLTRSQKEGYRGGDNFYIKEGKFIREFPIYDGSGKDAKVTAQKRQLEYGLRDNSFTVKQLSKDSTGASTVKPNTSTPVKSTAPVQQQNTAKKSGKKSKKHTPEKTPAKKKRRKHRSE